MISYQFLLNRLALLSFLITHGCVQNGIKNESPSEGAKNQIVVETKPHESNSSWVVEFSEDFSKMETGSEPESLFILDGAYTVQVDQNEEKSLTLPGSPMGDFGLLFGPRIREKGLELQFSFFSRKKGRRMPSIAAGIGGVRWVMVSQANQECRPVCTPLQKPFAMRMSGSTAGTEGGGGDG